MNISSRFNLNVNANQNRLISNEDYILEHNRINFAVLSLMDSELNESKISKYLFDSIFKEETVNSIYLNSVHFKEFLNRNVFTSTQNEFDEIESLTGDVLKLLKSELDVFFKFHKK